MRAVCADFKCGATGHRAGAVRISAVSHQLAGASAGDQAAATARAWSATWARWSMSTTPILSARRARVIQPNGPAQAWASVAVGGLVHSAA